MGLHVLCCVVPCVCRHHRWGFLMYEICLCRCFSSPTLLLHLFGGFTMSISPSKWDICFHQTPKPKTDDSKYNYIHFLLLFRPISLLCSVLWSNIIISHDDLNTSAEGGKSPWKLIRQARELEWKKHKWMKSFCTTAASTSRGKNHIVDGITISFFFHRLLEFNLTTDTVECADLFVYLLHLMYYLYIKWRMIIYDQSLCKAPRQHNHTHTTHKSIMTCTWRHKQSYFHRNFICRSRSVLIIARKREASDGRGKLINWNYYNENRLVRHDN